MDILNLPMQHNDANATTILDYLKALLIKVWEEDEEFSGKRPFGNSGWKNEIYSTLVAADLMREDYDWDEEHKADHLIIQAIAAIR